MNLATQGNTITCGEDAVLLATANPSTNIFWENSLGNLINNGSDQIRVNPFRSDTVTAFAIDTFGCIEQESLTIIDNGVDYRFVEIFFLLHTVRVLLHGVQFRQFEALR